jgi:AcrR family transcriptional regulator
VPTGPVPADSVPADSVPTGPAPAAGEARAVKGRAPHRRDENARLAVLHSADDLLVERGFNGVTIEGIAARAGVAKQTIYRWWPSKVDILLDTLIDDAAGQLAIPETGPAIEAIRRYLRALARFLTEEPAGKVLLALIGEAQHDAAVAETFHQRYLDPRREQERAILQRGAASGELPTRLDVDATLDALCGPVFYRALTGAPIPEGFIDDLIAGVLENAKNLGRVCGGWCYRGHTYLAGLHAALCVGVAVTAKPSGGRRRHSHGVEHRQRHAPKPSNRQRTRPYAGAMSTKRL